MNEMIPDAAGNRTQISGRRMTAGARGRIRARSFGRPTLPRPIAPQFVCGSSTMRSAVITIKSAQPGLSRQEFEYPVPLADARGADRASAGQSCCEKTRFHVRHAGRTWEVDVYSGENIRPGDRRDRAGERGRGGRAAAAGSGVKSPAKQRYYAARLAVRPFRSWPETARRGELAMAWRFEPGEGLRQGLSPRFGWRRSPRCERALAGPTAIVTRPFTRRGRRSSGCARSCRLAKPPLGADFAAENRRWRDAGRLLSGSRDTTVLLQSFDKLAAECAATFRQDGQAPASADCGSMAKNGARRLSRKSCGRCFALLDDAEASVAELDWPNSKPALLRGFQRARSDCGATGRRRARSARPRRFH